MARTNDKKKRLIMAADRLFLQKGFSETTLADIAELADVPLGNIYYYFRTKCHIVNDVIGMRFQMLKDLLAKIEEEHAQPHLQLTAFIHKFLDTSLVDDKSFGFMLTMMWVELSKENDISFREFLPLPEYVIDWCAKKLEATGKDQEEASGLAFWLLASIQGASSMPNRPGLTKSLLMQSKFIEHVLGT